MKAGNIATKLVSDTIQQGTGTIYTTIDSCALNHDGNTDTSHVEEMFLSATPTAQQAAYTTVEIKDGNLTVTTRQLNGFVLDSFSIASSGNSQECLPGDADSNGMIDLYDVLRILQSFAGWDVEVCTVCADMNGDGIVTIDDALGILELCCAGDMTMAERVLQEMLKSMPVNQLQIVKQPVSQYAMVGQLAEFAVSATGDGLSYQWYIDRNDGHGWRRMKGATSSAYMTPPTELDNDGFLYRCVIRDAYGSEVASDTAALHVVIDLPDTGDASEPMLYALAMIASAAVLLAYARKRGWQ